MVYCWPRSAREFVPLLNRSCRQYTLSGRCLQSPGGLPACRVRWTCRSTNYGVLATAISPHLAKGDFTMLSLDQASRQPWDVIVVGAGAAGALSARQIALAGAKVLLVDKAALGRWKVCGCCLNAAALATLTSVSLGELPGQLGAVPLERVQLRARGCQAEVALLQGVSLSRSAFDAALIEAAATCGVCFLSETHATLGATVPGGREVLLAQAGKHWTVRAKLVLAADGLGVSSSPNKRTFRRRRSPIQGLGPESCWQIRRRSFKLGPFIWHVLRADMSG